MEDIKKSTQAGSQQDDSSAPLRAPEPMGAVEIRTMRKDMAKIGGKPSARKPVGGGAAALPSNLPIADEPEKPAAPAPPPKVPAAPPALQKKEKRTAVPPIPPSGVAAPQPQEKFLTDRLKVVLVGVFVIFIMFAAGGFLYWWNYLRTPPSLPSVYYQCVEDQCLKVEGEGADECLIDADCQVTEPAIPQSLIQVDGTQTIELFAGEEDNLTSQLYGLLGSIPLGRQERILVKHIGRTERRYLDLASLFNYLDVEIPADISQALVPAETDADNYTFFMYHQEGENYPCLLLKLDGTDVSGVLGDWEATTMVSDWENFLMQSLPSDWEANEFHDNTYKDVPIRYINFLPIRYLSIDYAVIDNLLLIATSRESMYAAIDALK